ncbi:unnamed protein product [Orchesella dallaii]|uniref:Plasma membrane proteolipid 3 n=1 Tax=Orchesella dallaii TaxID=48710 RepID=A0ABP1QJ89_9HEXA
MTSTPPLPPQPPPPYKGEMKTAPNRTPRYSEAVQTWEEMMACCFPCGFVWFKDGIGSSCFLNMLLGCVFGPCCANICHACSRVGKTGKEGSPCATIANGGVGNVPTVKFADNMSVGEICLIILAVLFPPLAVFFAVGCGIDLLINILLCFLCYLPGIVHALYVLFVKTDKFKT